MASPPKPAAPVRSNAKTTLLLAIVLSAGLIMAWLLYLVLAPAPPSVTPAPAVRALPNAPPGDGVR